MFSCHYCGLEHILQQSLERRCSRGCRVCEPGTHRAPGGRAHAPSMGNQQGRKCAEEYLSTLCSCAFLHKEAQKWASCPLPPVCQNLNLCLTRDEQSRMREQLFRGQPCNSAGETLGVGNYMQPWGLKAQFYPSPGLRTSCCRT